MSAPKHTASAAARSRSPPLMPLPSLSTTVPGLTPFDRAVHVVNISNMASQSPTGTADSDKVSFSPEDQLLLYGAYKQATKGDVKGLKPTFFDIAARSKWQAWANMRGKSHQEAQEIYVDLVVKCLTRSGGHPDLHQQADEILQRPPSPQSSLSRPGSPSASPNLDKDLPPIQIESPSAPYTTPLSITPASSISSHSPHQHHTQRKGSISHSIRSVTTGGMRSAAASVYELAPETLADSDVESAATGPTNSNSNHQSDAGYHEITETVVEEEILNDEEYAAEVHTSKSAPLDNVAAAMGESMDVEDATEHDRQDEDDDDDDVYQSSEEYESDSDSITSESATSVASSSGKLTPSPQPNTLDQRFHPHNQDKDDLVDEGVFEEEEKDELKAEEEGLLGSPPALDAALSPEVDTLVGLQDQDDGSRYTATEKPRISRDGSVSSGYGGSVLSDKGVVSILDIRNIALSGKDEIFSKTEDPASPSVEPYRVHALHDTTIATPNTQDLEINGAETDSMTSKTSTTVQSVGKSEATPAHALDGLVCPVSKKTAASGAVCPAAMFAQARAAAEAEKSGQSLKSGSLNTSTTPAVDDANAEPSHSPSAKHQRAMTEPAMTATTSAQEATSPPQSSLSQSAPTSAVTAATNQGKRIGQGIVSRFSALRNSLAAASARAASSALSGNPLGSSSSSASKSTDNPNAVVVKDPITNQSVTVVCPHLTTTHLLETEVVRLQTDISVLHERLDLLQESLKVKSQTRAQERRSARGIFKLVLRQGLINAILLLIVFAVLYKRKSPIAFAILAYIGEGRREGEAGWRALMRWGADMIRVGQRNQQYMLRAGRRNGYW